MDIQNQIKERFVAFIDVLGFSELVLRNNIKEIESYFSSIAHTLEKLSEFHEENTIEYLAISDSIIIFSKDNDLKSFLTMITFVRNIQITLIDDGFLIRGGIALGQACYIKKENIIFGKGYIEAYHLEKEAIYPRVIISPKIVSHLFRGNYKEFLLNVNGARHNLGLFEHGVYWETKTVDMDGKNEAQSKVIHEYSRTGNTRITKNDSVFVSYAHFFIYLSLQNDSDYKKSTLKRTLDFIAAGLYSEQKHHLKYRWLKDYFLETLLEMQSINNNKNWCVNLPNSSLLTEALKDFDNIG
jgi:hypothetical protein